MFCDDYRLVEQEFSAAIGLQFPPNGEITFYLKDETGEGHKIVVHAGPRQETIATQEYGVTGVQTFGLGQAVRTLRSASLTDNLHIEGELVEKGYDGDAVMPVKVTMHYVPIPKPEDLPELQRLEKMLASDSSGEGPLRDVRLARVRAHIAELVGA